jgi:hypothetical protein
MAVKPKKAVKREEATAYHEAGHAVAAWVMDRPFRYVTIVPMEGTLGHVQHPAWREHVQPDINVDGRTRRLLEKAIFTLLAGVRAEKRLTGRWNNIEANSDFHDADDLASYLWGNPKVLQKYISFMESRVDAMIASDRHWKGIQALAAALLEKRRIGYQEAQEIITAAVRPSLPPLPVAWTQEVDAKTQ